MKLNKIDTLIWKLYKNSKEQDATYILEKDSIDNNKLIIRIPIIEWTNNGKERKELQRKILITNNNIEVLYERKIKEEENNENFINKRIYNIVKCNEDITRMTIENRSINIFYNKKTNTYEKVKTTTPSIIYLNNNGEIINTTLEKNKSKIK